MLPLVSAWTFVVLQAISAGRVKNPLGVKLESRRRGQKVKGRKEEDRYEERKESSVVWPDQGSGIWRS